MRTVRLWHFLAVLLVGVGLWLGYRVWRPGPDRMLRGGSGKWERIFAEPVRSLTVAGDAVVLGTYRGSVALRCDGAPIAISGGPASAESPWGGTVFALATDSQEHAVYEGRDRVYEAGMLRLDSGSWQPLPRLEAAERWTVWSLAIGDAVYAGTGKGVWVHGRELGGGEWQFVGPPLGQGRLPVFSLLYTEGGLYAGTFDGIWLYRNGEWQYLADGPRGKVLALAELFWKGERYLATGTGGGLFLRRGTEPWRRVEGDYPDDPVVYGLAFDAKGGVLFAGMADGVARLDLSRGDRPNRFDKVGLSGAVMALAWHDGALIAGGDKGAFVWREERR